MAEKRGRPTKGSAPDPADERLRRQLQRMRVADARKATGPPWEVVMGLEGGWRVTAEIEPEGGVPVIRSLHIEPAGDEMPSGGLTARKLRAPMTEALLAEAQKGLAQVGRLSGGRELLGRMRYQPEARRPGRRGHSLLHYAQAARVYEEAWLARERNIHTVVAKAMGVATTTAPGLIAKARELGLLTKKGGRGGRGGQLTDKAKEILATQGIPTRRRRGDGT